MKRFTIKSKKAGEQSWKILENVTIYASNFSQAKLKFKEWVLGWMDEINNDQAISLVEQVRSEPSQAVYGYDNEVFTIMKV